MSETRRTTPTPTRTITYTGAWLRDGGARIHTDKLRLVYESDNLFVWAHVMDEEVWTNGGPTDCVFVEHKRSGVCMLVNTSWEQVVAKEWDFERSTTGKTSFSIARKER